MLIQLQNQKIIDSEKIVSIKKVLEKWCLKLANAEEVELSNGEYEWLMTSEGNILEINDTTAVNISVIVAIKPDQLGYLVSWEGEPPIVMSKEKGDALIQYLSNYKHYMVLDERIQFLQKQNIEPTYNKL